MTMPQRASWLVCVVNLETGEERYTVIRMCYRGDAQYEAVTRAFYDWGWRRSGAFQPDPIRESAEVA